MARPRGAKDKKKRRRRTDALITTGLSVAIPTVSGAYTGLATEKYAERRRLKEANKTIEGIKAQKMDKQMKKDLIKSISQEANSTKNQLKFKKLKRKRVIKGATTGLLLGLGSIAARSTYNRIRQKNKK